MKSTTIIAVLLLAFIAGTLGFYLQRYISGPVGVNPVKSLPLPAGESLLGRLRPEFTLKDTDGNFRIVSEWDGKILVINFWATWCPPCRQEMPMFAKLQEKYADQGVQFIGIAAEETDEVTDFIREIGVNYPILTGASAAIKVAEEYGNRLGALPYTVIIDRSQHIIYTKTGPLHREEAEAILGSVL